VAYALVLDMWYEVGHMAFWLAQRSVMKLPGVGFATTTDMCVNSPVDWCFFNLGHAIDTGHKALMPGVTSLPTLVLLCI